MEGRGRARAAGRGGRRGGRGDEGSEGARGGGRRGARRGELPSNNQTRGARREGGAEAEEVSRARARNCTLILR